MADIRIDNLAGRTILYDRAVPGHYGMTGVPIVPFIEETFAAECEACFAELIALLEATGFGPVGSILTGGISRAGTGSSLHHRNRAFDLDGLILPGENWVADGFPRRPLLYLGIESVIRKHFGTVLAYDYNAAHEDHIHFDNGTATGFKKDAKSHVIYLQNTVFFVYGIAIGRDGVWGPETRAKSDDVRGLLGLGGFSTKANWIEYLSVTAVRALELDRQIPPPGG